MKNTRQNNAVLLHSILWAIAMLVISYLLAGTEYGQTSFIFLVGGWYISNNILICKQNGGNATRCYSRYFNKNQSAE